MKKALIVGATGFAGKVLADYLISEGDVELHGTYRIHPPTPKEGIIYHRADLLDLDGLIEVMTLVAPDEVYNLAGFSFPPAAEIERVRAGRINIEGGQNLYEAVATGAPSAVVVTISTGEIYGRVDPAEIPLTEERPAAPATHYAATKQCLEILTRQYLRNPGLDIRIARPFNHTGPGQDDMFVAPAFACQVAAIEAGKADPVIVTGALDPERDFTDVRDVARAYVAIARQGRKGEIYNVCSGKPTPIKVILDTLLALSTRQDIAHSYDQARMRPAENKKVTGSAEKLQKETGWTPTISLADTLKDLLDDKRRELK